MTAPRRLEHSVPLEVLRDVRLAWPLEGRGHLVDYDATRDLFSPEELRAMCGFALPGYVSGEHLRASERPESTSYWCRACIRSAVSRGIARMLPE